jgi:hypothetical protein
VRFLANQGTWGAVVIGVLILAAEVMFERTPNRLSVAVRRRLTVAMVLLLVLFGAALAMYVGHQAPHGRTSASTTSTQAARPN